MDGSDRYIIGWTRILPHGPFRFFFDACLWHERFELIRHLLPFIRKEHIMQRHGVIFGITRGVVFVADDNIVPWFEPSRVEAGKQWIFERHYSCTVDTQLMQYSCQL